MEAVPRAASFLEELDLSNNTADLRFRRTLSAGGPWASCGVSPGHAFPAGVAALHSNQIDE